MCIWNQNQFHLVNVDLVIFIQIEGGTGWPLRSPLPLRFCHLDIDFCPLLSLCVSRYKAVVKPLERQPSNAILKTCAKAGCIWIVSMLIALPEAIFSNVYTFHDPNRNMTFEACASYPVSERLLQEIHSLLCFLVFYIIPLSIISVYYSLIARTLYKSTLNIPTEEQSHARKQVCINQHSCRNLEVRCLLLPQWARNTSAVEYFCYGHGLWSLSDPGFNSILAEQSWASYFTSLSLNSLLCQMKTRAGW